MLGTGCVLEKNVCRCGMLASINGGYSYEFLYISIACFMLY